MPSKIRTLNVNTANFPASNIVDQLISSRRFSIKCTKLIKSREAEKVEYQVTAAVPFLLFGKIYINLFDGAVS